MTKTKKMKKKKIDPEVIRYRLVILAFFLASLFTTLFWSCSKDVDIVPPENSDVASPETDVIIKSLETISDEPEFITNSLKREQTGRAKGFKKDITKTVYELDGEKESTVSLNIHDSKKNATASLVYNESTGTLLFITYEIELPNGNRQISCLSKDGKQLLFQIEGLGTNFHYTHFENQSLTNGRGFGDSFFDCIKKTRSTNTFIALELSSLLLSASTLNPLPAAAVAAGLVIGCAASSSGQAGDLMEPQTEFPVEEKSVEESRGIGDDFEDGIYSPKEEESTPKEEEVNTPKKITPRQTEFASEEQELISEDQRVTEQISIDEYLESIGETLNGSDNEEVNQPKKESNSNSQEAVGDIIITSNVN